MNFYYALFLYPTILTSLLSVSLAIYAWRQRKVLAANTFAIFMLDVAFWSLATGLLELSESDQMALVWYKLRYLSIATVPVFIIIFAFQFTRRDTRFFRHAIPLLFIIPLITQVIIWTRFDYFVTDVIFTRAASLTMIENDNTGTWFTIHLVYSISVIGVGEYLILLEALHSTSVYRRQAIALLVGVIPPVLVSGIFATFFYRGFAHFLPISFFITGLILCWALFRYQLLDVLPIAKSILIDSMDDGLLVLDSQKRLIEINPVAELIMGVESGRSIGKKLEDISLKSPNVLPLMDLFHKPSEEKTRMQVNQQYLDLRIIPIADTTKKQAGSMVVIHDVTDWVNINQRLENELLEIQALQEELKQQAIRDPLTGLYNRRYLDEIIGREYARAKREDYPISMVMVDIDHFKQINDTYGHGVGDLVLQKLAEQMMRMTRQVDIVCRMGGEEFLIVLLNSNQEFSVQRANEWRQSISRTKIEEPHNIYITISMGIATYPDQGEDLDVVIALADQALYQAKMNGRDRVEIYGKGISA